MPSEEGARDRTEAASAVNVSPVDVFSFSTGINKSTVELEQGK